MNATTRPYRTSRLATLLTGGGYRKTRFHDEAGGVVTFSRVVRNAPRALVTGLLKHLVGRRPERPWISYDAQALLAKFLTPRSRVLEFGSGMSTLWYARKAGQVISIEDDAPWYELLEERLRALGNVDYRFVSERAAYTSAAPEGQYELIMIDGNWRDECADFAVRNLAPGGVIYLDNSDMGHNPESTGDVPRARAVLLSFAEREGLATREFTDFAPTQLHAQRGLMVGGIAG